MDARPTIERNHFEARILGQHPARRMFVAEPRLDYGVRVVRRAGFRRVVVSVERLDRPAGKKSLELPRLVAVAGAENRL
jgi:hypothetical protein